MWLLQLNMRRRLLTPCSTSENCLLGILRSCLAKPNKAKDVLFFRFRLPGAPGFIRILQMLTAEACFIFNFPQSSRSDLVPHGEHADL